MVTLTSLHPTDCPVEFKNRGQGLTESEQPPQSLRYSFHQLYPPPYTILHATRYTGVKTPSAGPSPTTSMFLTKSQLLSDVQLSPR